MLVHHDKVRLKIEELAVERQVVAVVLECGGVLQIAHVLGEDRLAVSQQAEGVLQLAPHREDSASVGKLRMQPNGLRCITAGPTQKARGAVDQAQHRVVKAIDDVAVMQQKGISDTVQAFSCLIVAGALGLLAAVARGEHDGAFHRLHQ